MVLQAAAPPPLQAAAAVRAPIRSRRCSAPEVGGDDASAPNEEGRCHEPMRERGRDEEERGRELRERERASREGTGIVDFEIEGAGKIKFPRNTPHVLGKYMFPYGFRRKP